MDIIAPTHWLDACAIIAYLRQEAGAEVLKESSSSIWGTDWSSQSAGMEERPDTVGVASQLRQGRLGPPVAEYASSLEVQPKDVPPGHGTGQEIPATDRLEA